MDKKVTYTASYSCGCIVTGPEEKPALCPTHGKGMYSYIRHTVWPGQYTTTFLPLLPTKRT